MRILLLFGTFLMTLQVLGQTMVSGFSAGLHTGGSTITTTANFPADVSTYNQVLMHVSLDCPAGGCDPWDRFANLYLEVDGVDIEIGRYITPYGNDWCDWTIDVSEYRNFLTGTRTLKSHIETWQNGWLVNTEFEFITGTPTYAYTSVQNLWSDYQFTYGDTLFYSINLPEKLVDIPANTESALLRIVNTGHGQGNTDNAAEFAPKTHSIHVNGNQEFTQFLWNDDCDQNPCSPQGGTWQFDRAGWCPGEDVVPADYNLNSFMTAGQSMTLDYVLEPFFNLCSPWNPGCSPGTTCAECTYNSNGHTEPHYKIAGQLILHSNTPFPTVSVKEYLLDDDTRIYPNPSAGVFNLAMDLGDSYEVVVTDLQGRTIFTESFLGLSHQLDLTDQARGIYFVNIQSQSRTYNFKVMLDN
ncbi:MAG: peptide-N-glycosidase F-related protein [Salibacteraceae bacterium]